MNSLQIKWVQPWESKFNKLPTGSIVCAACAIQQSLQTNCEWLKF